MVLGGDKLSPTQVTVVLGVLVRFSVTVVRVLVTPHHLPVAQLTDCNVTVSLKHLTVYSLDHKTRDSYQIVNSSVANTPLKRQLICILDDKLNILYISDVNKQAIKQTNERK